MKGRRDVSRLLSWIKNLERSSRREQIFPLALSAARISRFLTPAKKEEKHEERETEKEKKMKMKMKMKMKKKENRKRKRK